MTPGSDKHASVGDESTIAANAEHASLLSEKLQRRTSFSKAKLVKSSSLRAPSSTGLTREHQEQGRVKIDVYKQYIKATSKIGFFCFLLTTIGQQAASVFATLTLRYWGEHNREVGDNSGMFRYLLIYGLFSLSSIILGGVSAILMWVYCALKSAKRLHDSVIIFSLFLLHVVSIFSPRC